MKRLWTAALLVVMLVACKDAETRAREAQDKILAQLVDPSAAALEQKASPETIKQAQQDLTAVHEYLGEVNGVIDQVTVNAIQAFQVTQGLKSDGMLTERTMSRLREVAQKKG